MFHNQWFTAKVERNAKQTDIFIIFFSLTIPLTPTLGLFVYKEGTSLASILVA